MRMTFRHGRDAGSGVLGGWSWSVGLCGGNDLYLARRGHTVPDQVSNRVSVRETKGGLHVGAMVVAVSVG